MKYIIALLCFQISTAIAIPPDQKTLPIYLTEEEKKIWNPNAIRLEADTPPTGPIHSLGEWEESIEAMTLYQNASFVRGLAENGKVRLIADTESDKKSWQNWLRNNQINDVSISYFVVPTDTIWIRDYGPWYIIDGNGNFSLIDSKYNRPRPQDDIVPDFIARTLNLPIYHTGLVHTGGNYYSDGMGNGFSSTLVYSENQSLNKDLIHLRMSDFLGLSRYTTSPLSPGVTIEHLDTFGKLVAPDRWIWSRFPTNSRHYKDSEKYLAILNTLKSPYGTPYKIFRMDMVPRSGSSGEDYRAYINSFISNGALYFPTYGDSKDEIAKAVYQQALPSYKIVGASAPGTEWGDSLHCRSRNLINWNTVFIFPTVEHLSQAARVTAKIYPSPGATITAALLHVKKPDGTFTSDAMKRTEKFTYELEIPDGTTSFYVEAQDSAQKTKTAPIRAPSMLIDL